MFLFSLGNGTCEAVINPLTATLFPKNKTHWLNILHAGWPGGPGPRRPARRLIFRQVVEHPLGNPDGHVPGADAGLRRHDGRPDVPATRRPASSGISRVDDAVNPARADPPVPVLTARHGRLRRTGHRQLDQQHHRHDDGEPEHAACWLFIWTSCLMFALRFFAGPIVHKISPAGPAVGQRRARLHRPAAARLPANGVLFASWRHGLRLRQDVLWPTMLGVASERFPRGGALALGTVGGVGMLSAGLLGGPASATRRITSPAPSCRRRRTRPT